METPQSHSFEESTQSLLVTRVHFMSQVYLWMMIGVLLTAGTALGTALSDELTIFLRSRIVCILG